MNSLPASIYSSTRRMPKKSHTTCPKETKKPYTKMPQNKLTSTGDAAANVKKPMRPLTAYHIYFQIEREYIIQTESGPDVSIDENKSYVYDVPRRYRSIKLLPDWYAGPGKKQQKRRHRKSHGKIGFLELSRVISKRWATLGSSDPETKRYVSQIAARELEEYKMEMQQYKELIATIDESVSAPLNDANVPNDALFTATKPTVDSTALVSVVTPTIQPCQPLNRISSLISLDEDILTAFYACDQEDVIDYTICSVNNNGHYIPAPGSDLMCLDELACDPLYELEDEYNICNHIETKRCVSPLSFDMDVGVVSDDDFF